MDSTKILVVDDDAFVRDILADILQSAGYEVQLAKNGSMAFDRLEDWPCDLIISDIHMPVLDGLGLIRKLRQEAQKETPLIVLSGNNEVSVAIEAINLGANDYLLKDENLQDTVLLSIEQTLEKRRIVVQNRELLKDITKKNRELSTIVNTMTEIGLAVTSEKNFKALMEVIITHARALTNADAATLYLIENNQLYFKIVQNETLNIFLGGKSGAKIEFPPVEVHESNVSGYVAIKRKAVNIADVYETDLFDFTGPKKFDRTSNYRSKSMLVVPMIDRANAVVGVLQLLNALDPDTREVIPFSEAHVEVVESLGSQAAVAVTNLRLEEKTERLLEEVLNIKNYNENILESLTNGVITLDNNLNIITANEAAQRILGRSAAAMVSKPLSELFGRENAWVLDHADQVVRTHRPSIAMDMEIHMGSGQPIPMNLSLVPLKNVKKELIGSMLVFEDITTEKRMKTTMARYMTQELAEKLLESGEDMLGGKIQEATVLFSDIRDFTTITERLGAQETVALLNEYFTVMVDYVFQHKGLLDKYIGDALLAVFGAPFKSDQDADNAVQAAIGMAREVNELNTKRKAENLEIIQMGIGINTDEVLSGNIGSIKRMDYTCIGDGVNLASRLEGLNKHYGTKIIISEHTCRKLKGIYKTRKLDWIRVKGKLKPVIIYEVLDYLDDANHNHLDERIQLFQEGLTLYQGHQWEKARLQFEQVLKICPDDEAAQTYIHRTRHFETKPPPENWDGAWVMDSK